jgi:nicotinate-nucleotide adenylyltransferase
VSTRCSSAHAWSSSTVPAIDWIRVEVPRLEVSSTDLRERCADGRPLDYLVPDAVLDVIRERGLYGVVVHA